MRLSRDLGFVVKSVWLVPEGGYVRREPLSPDSTAEELERDLAVAYAGAEAERYAPESVKERDDPWLTFGELTLAGSGPSETVYNAADEAVPGDEERIASHTAQLDRRLLSARKSSRPSMSSVCTGSASWGDSRTS